MRRATGAAAVTLCLAGLLSAVAGARDDDGAPEAWDALERLRSSFEAASPVAVAFSQTYTPAGFSSGDTESGVLSMDLPSCARWDYDDPFPRSYLLCDDIAYSWNPGESSGRRYEISADERRGLDLLRLDVDELREQYAAGATATAVGLEIFLRPLEQPAPVAEATLTLSRDLERLIHLAFVDNEGSRTLFELGEYRPVAEERRFNPPAGVEWLEN